MYASMTINGRCAPFLYPSAVLHELLSYTKLSRIALRVPLVLLWIGLMPVGADLLISGQQYQQRKEQHTPRTRCVFP